MDMLEVSIGGAEEKFTEAQVTIDDLRAQLAALTAERDALVGAVIERAAEVCTAIIKDYDVMKPDGKTYEPLRVQKAAKGMVSLVRQDIRALATHDHHAAIEAVKAEARAEGMRAAWPHVRKVICSQDWTDCDGDVFCEAIESAILAAAQKEAQG